MATYFARKSGNINASDVWATTPSGTAAAVAFASGDVLVANLFAIAVNVDCNLGATGQVRNDTTGGATNGGGFALASGVTLTANVYGNANGVSAGCVTFSTPNTATIVAGTIAAGSNNSAVDNSGSGTLTITVSGTVGNGNGTNGNGVRNSSSGTIYLTASGGIFGGAGGSAYGVTNTSTGNIFITGNVTGGTHPVGPHGAFNSAGGVIEITGTATGGLSSGAGAFNNNGTMRVTKAVGNGFGPGTTGLTATPGVSGSNANSITTVEKIEFGALGQSPTSGAVRLVADGSNNANFYTTTGQRKTLIDATANAAMPAASDVRSGVSYASGAATGSCAVPAAGSVALGVPVDAGFGTAVLTAAAIRAELATELGRIDAAVSSRLAPNGTLATVTNLTNAPASVTPSDIWSHATRTITGGLVDTATTLTNSPTVPTASAIASQVRTELATELSRVDAAVSTRLAGSAYTAPSNSDVAAIKAKTDLLNTDRLAQASTVATTGAQIAAALS